MTNLPNPTPHQPDNDSRIARFLGGSPGAVALRLAILSVIVGLIMAVVGLTPYGVFEAVQRLIDHVVQMGWGFVGKIGGYLLLGAGVVIPVWLVLRLMKASR